MELAKMTGITPAELILIGKNEARAILCVWPPPFPECCTGIFLFDSSMKVTKAMMSKYAKTYNKNLNIPAIASPSPLAKIYGEHHIFHAPVI